MPGKQTQSIIKYREHNNHLLWGTAKMATILCSHSYEKALFPRSCIGTDHVTSWPRLHEALQFPLMLLLEP